MHVSARALSLLVLATAMAPVTATRASAQAPTAPAAATAAPATPAAEPAPARKLFSFGISANTTAMNADAAAKQMIGPRSYGMQLDAGMNFARFLFASIDIGPQFLSDRASFTQTTTAGDMSSTASLLYFSAMAGAKSPAVQFIPGIPAMSLGLYGGSSATAGKRSIDKCTDCYSEDISIPGGAFVQPTLVLGGGNARVRVSDRYYTGGTGMRSVISLGMEFGGH